MNEISDTRPDWVKALMRFSHHSGQPIEGRPERNGRWSFVPCCPNDKVAVGVVSFMHMPDGEVRPAIKADKKWIDLRTDEGRVLHAKHYEVV